MGLHSGNALVEGAQQKEWLIGCFIPKGDLHRSCAVEAKCEAYKENEKSEEWPHWSSSDATTFTMLISGRVLYEFKQHGVGLILEKSCDYVLFDPSVLNRWKVLKKSVILTFRWPSRPRK